MPTAEITVQQVKAAEPPKKMGWIKSAEGEYYNCPPPMLHLFSQGEVCKIEFTTKPKAYGGGTWKTLVTKLGGPMKGPAPMRASTSPKDSEQIFVCALLKEMIGPDDSLTSVFAKGNMLKAVYQKLFGSPENQKSEIELNDEIPDF